MFDNSMQSIMSALRYPIDVTQLQNSRSLRICVVAQSSTTTKVILSFSIHVHFRFRRSGLFSEDGKLHASSG